MYPITSEVKALFDAEQRQVLRITGTDKNGATISITDADVMLGGFNIDRYACNSSRLEIGTAIAAELSLRLYNSNGQFNSIAFEGAELFVEVGIADWSQTTPDITYIPCGYFICDHQPRKLNTIALKALDRMMLFDQPVGAASLTFPATVANLVSQVCTLCGVTLGMVITGLPNASYSIASLPSLQQMITYRNLIQWCAGMMGTNAWMDWNGQLRFSWFGTATGYESTTANRFVSDLYEDDIEITGVTYTGTDDTTVVSGMDDYALDLTGNYLIGTGVSTILPNINTVVNGFTYRPFEATVINAPYLWPMDALTFTDKGGNDHATILTNVNFGLNGTTGLAGRGETAQTNSGTAPSAMTNEQKFMLEKFDTSLNQQSVFDRLTNNGAAQGFFLQNGQLYVNASYIRSGTLVLGGLNNQNGTLQVLDAYGNNAGVWANDGIIFERYDPEQQWTIHTYICSPFTGTWVPLQVKASSFETTIGVGQIHVTGNTYYNGAGRIRHVYIDNYRILLTDPDVNKSLEISADAPTTLSNLGVKKKTITPTTSSSGGINANLDPTRYVVLSAYSVGYICIPYRAANGTDTYCKVLDTSMNPVASTAVSIDITYLDLGANAFS